MGDGGGGGEGGISPEAGPGKEGGVKKLEAWQKNYSHEKMIESIIGRMFGGNCCPGGELPVSDCALISCANCWREVLKKVVKEG